MTTKQIQELICRMEVLKSNLPCENVKYLFSDWEIDVLSINKNSYLTDYEVKISRSDFKVDALKTKHEFYKMKIESMICNYFYYVCPEDIIWLNEIPEYAGLIYVKGEELVIVKRAKLIHKFKHNRDKVLTKICRIKSEREYLGSCYMTYKNKKSK